MQLNLISGSYKKFKYYKKTRFPQNAGYRVIMAVRAQRDMSLTTPPSPPFVSNLPPPTALERAAECRLYGRHHKNGKNGTCCFISVMFSV